MGRAVTDLSVPQVLALMVVAAKTAEGYGLPIDGIQPEHRLIYRALEARELIRVSSPRKAALSIGLPAPDVPDAYVLTDAGAARAIEVLTQHH